MLPEGWKKVSLADAVRQKISYGIVQAGPHVDGGIPYIKSSDVRDDISLTSLQRTSTDIHRKYIRSSVHPGDIVFSLRGNIGATCIVPPEISEANLTQGTARISCSQKVYPNFLIQELRTSSCIQQALNLSKGSTFKEISLESLRTLKIILPPLPEQKEIAAILSTWDRAIDGAEKLLANSQQQKKALMQQLLTGKKRLPGFTGEWKFTTLDSLTDQINNGLNYDSKTTSGLPVTRIETISLGKIDFSKIGYAPDNDKTRNFKLKSGDILYSHINSIDHIGKVSYYNHEKDLYHGMNLLNIRTNKKNSSCYLYYIFQSHIGKKFAVTHAKSAVNQASISISDLKMFLLKMPPLPEQQAIAAVLSTADEEIAAIEADLARLRQEKKALMQQLLTGKRRVKVD